jgi:hypothetical protein
MPKNINAIASTSQIANPTFNNSNGISNTNDPIIPIPHTLNIILRFFFCSVITPEDLVNKKNELKANNPKKITAVILCIQPLTPAGNWKVPTNVAGSISIELA